MNAVIYYLAFPLLYVISRLPFPIFYGLSDLVCFFLYRVFGYRKKVVRSNLKRVFPDLSEKELLKIERDFYSHLCDLFLEIIKSMGMSKKEMMKRFQVVNIEALTQFEKAEEVVDRVIKQHQRNGIARWTAIEKNTGKYMGWSGIKLYQQECCGHINFYEIGYRFKPEYWGKGYATETAKAALDHIFNVLKADVAYAMTHHENQASKRVLEKIGFIKTQEYVEDGIPCFFFQCRK